MARKGAGPSCALPRPRAIANNHGVKVIFSVITRY